MKKRPRTKFAYENLGNGAMASTKERVKPKEAFPGGSLAKYVTKERDSEMLALLKGTVPEPG